MDTTESTSWEYRSSVLQKASAKKHIVGRSSVVIVLYASRMASVARICRRYALEAIINDIIYFRVQNYDYVPCYNCYGSRVCNNTRLGGRLICTCGIINGKKYS